MAMTVAIAFTPGGLKDSDEGGQFSIFFSSFLLLNVPTCAAPCIRDRYASSKEGRNGWKKKAGRVTLNASAMELLQDRSDELRENLKDEKNFE